MKDLFQVDPNASCKLCELTNDNKICLLKHPDFRRKNSRNKKPGKVKGSTRVAIVVDDEASDGGLENKDISLGKVASFAVKSKNRLLYNTGISHHFVR